MVSVTYKPYEIKTTLFVECFRTTHPKSINATLRFGTDVTIHIVVQKNVISTTKIKMLLYLPVLMLACVYRCRTFICRM